MDKMITIGNIVTLSDMTEYLLFSEIPTEDRRFIYAVKVMPDERPTGEWKIFEAVEFFDGEYLKEVDDIKLFFKLRSLFKEIIAKEIESNVYVGLDDEFLRILLESLEYWG